MYNYTLSRSSWAYKFVFGKQKEWRLYGHPEPGNDRISLGLFIVLFAVMLFMRPIVFIMMTFIKFGISVISFLMDGSYTRGDFPTELKIVKIKPWPIIFGHRFPPWILLMTGIVGSAFYYFGLWKGAEFMVYCIMIILIFRSITPESKSLTTELSKAIEPKLNEKLRIAYYREPKLFPALHLID